MSEKNVIVKTQDFYNDENLKKFMGTIKEKNEVLYRSIFNKIKSDGFPGMRKDVLKCLMDYADRIPEDINMDVSFYIAEIIGNHHVMPDGYIWLLDYTSRTKLGVNTVTGLFSMAVDKGISSSEMNDIFNGDDELEIMRRIDEYQSSDLADNSLLPDQADISMVEKNPEKQGNENMVSVFGDLLTVMTYGKHDEEDMVFAAQNKCNEIVAGLQSGLNNMGVFLGEVIHTWEADKEEILRLKAIYNMQQRILASVQRRLHEADAEILRLTEAVHDAEKRENRYKTIDQKVQEIQKLITESGLSVEGFN